MTVDWTAYAQSLTDSRSRACSPARSRCSPWSFVRDDQPRSETCEQVALAIRDEVADLEAAGIEIIQVDEPALREGLPLRRDRGRVPRLGGRLRSARHPGVRDETQIHTHMCYSEFGDIMERSSDLDADVHLIEAARSHMELLDDWERTGYEHEIGPGVYDIHSPRVPSTEEMAELLQAAAKVARPEQLWVNPDCGLKTRGWPEVEAALSNMVAGGEAAARRARPGRLTRGRVGSAKNWHRGGRPGVPSVGAAPPLPEPAVRFDRWLPPVRADISVCRHQVESATRPRLRCA